MLLTARVPVQLTVPGGTQITWNGDGFSEAAFVVLRTESDFAGAAVDLTAVSLSDDTFSVFPGAWCDDDYPDFDDPEITESQKQDGGFWCADIEDEVWTFSRWSEGE